MGESSLVIKQSLKVRAGDEVMRRRSFYTAEESPEARELSASLSCLLKKWIALGLEWPTVKVSSIIDQLRGRVAGGMVMKEKAKASPETVARLWLEFSTTAEHNRAARIARRLNVSSRHIRNVRRKTEQADK